MVNLPVVVTNSLLVFRSVEEVSKVWRVWHFFKPDWNLLTSPIVLLILILLLFGLPVVLGNLEA